jgi:hypothetical protein
LLNQFLYFASLWTHFSSVEVDVLWFNYLFRNADKWILNDIQLQVIIEVIETIDITSSSVGVGSNYQQLPFCLYLLP